MKKVEKKEAQVIKMGGCGNDGCTVREILPYCEIKKAA